MEWVLVLVQSTELQASLLNVKAIFLRRRNFAKSPCYDARLSSSKRQLTKEIITRHLPALCCFYNCTVHTINYLLHQLKVSTVSGRDQNNAFEGVKCGARRSMWCRRGHMPVSVHTHHNISDITTCVVRDATMCADIPNTTIGDNTHCWRSACQSLQRQCFVGRDRLRGHNKVLRDSDNCGRMPRI